MKKKISVSIEEEILKLIDLELLDGKFRNKSHVLEYAVRELLKRGGEK